MSMMETAAIAGSVDSAEAGLRRLLARGDALAGTVAPVLRHLLANDDNSLFSDEIVARIRGMVFDLARQLLGPATDGEGEPWQDEGSADAISILAGLLYADPALLAHLHAIALEWQLAERLQSNQTVDPVLSPLLQALISSQESETAALAMKLLASQARFCQTQRRMQLPLLELPADLLHATLISLREMPGMDPEMEEKAVAAEAAIRASYDEGGGRLGLLARLVSGMGMGVLAALSLRHAGVAIFLSALATGSGQDRDAAVLSTTDTQLARLALALRMAGLKSEAVQEELYVMNPDFSLPEGFSGIGPDRAAAILAATRGYGGG